MAFIVLFHSVLGLRDAERDLAARWQADGHAVSLPDLYNGQATDIYEEGFRLKDAVGDALIDERARAALAEAPQDAVLAGVSFGAFLVGQYWAERPQMPGALLLAGVAPWAALRPGLPVHVHIARPDPFDDEDFFAAWSAANPGADLHLHRYDGAGHYFLDRSLPDFDPAAADLCLDRCREFLLSL